MTTKWFSDFSPAPDEFKRYLAIIEAADGINEQPVLRYGREEVYGPLSKEAFLQLGSKLGPEWQVLIDAHSGLTPGSEEEAACDIPLGPVRILVKLSITDVSPPDGRIDDGLITMAMHPSLRVCVSAKFAEHPIARCEVLIPDITFPVGWLDLPLRATATVFNAERGTAFYIMKDLAATKQTIDVPDDTYLDEKMVELYASMGTCADGSPMTPDPSSEILSQHFGKTDRVTFGAKGLVPNEPVTPEAALIYSPAEDDGTHQAFADFAILNAIKVDATTANLSLSFGNANYAGIFAIHDPTFFVSLLTKRNII